jgi:hypothetical protein
VLALTSTPANPFVALREVEAPIARGATQAKQLDALLARRIGGNAVLHVN